MKYANYRLKKTFFGKVKLQGTYISLPANFREEHWFDVKMKDLYEQEKRAIAAVDLNGHILSVYK